MTTTETQNKACVLEAFDTLFNKRDYAAAERFWSPAYIQHSAQGDRRFRNASLSARSSASGWELAAAAPDARFQFEIRPI
jgi:hypothetical protein